MSPSLLLVSANPEAFADQHGAGRTLRWPHETPALLTAHWSRLTPMLDALSAATRVRRLGLDEALALPLVPEMAVVIELGTAGERLSLSTDPGNAARLASLLVGLGYAEDRVAGVPLDVLGRLLPGAGRAAGLTQTASILSLARELLAALRDPRRWLAMTDRSEAGLAAARVLSLAGMTLVPPAATSIPTAARTPMLAEIDGGFELRIPVEGLRKDLLRLASAEGRLLVSTDGVTIPVELPAALKRCRVTGASTDAGALVVRFQIDEQRWR